MIGIQYGLRKYMPYFSPPSVKKGRPERRRTLSERRRLYPGHDPRTICMRLPLEDPEQVAIENLIMCLSSKKAHGTCRRISFDGTLSVSKNLS
jgi:hypothetical protein